VKQKEAVLLRVQNEAPSDIQVALDAAMQGLNCLAKKDIDEMKALKSPPVAVLECAKALVILMKGPKAPNDWNVAKSMMSNPN
jgi:hypothetical protein